jgi:PAS domain S-box-containing protein
MDTIFKDYTILYVEDDAVLRLLTEKMLKEYFSNIDMCENGIDALEQYKKYHELHGCYYDIVITDIEMPFMDGKELSREIFKINTEQPVIVFSAHSEADELEELINIGITNYLHKPIVKNEFFKVLDRAIKQVNEKKEKELKNKEITRLNHELDLMQKNRDSYVITSKTDLNGVITYASKAFEKISGYSKEELIGQYHSIVRHPDMPSEVFKEMWETIKSEKLWSGEVKNLRRDGSYYWVKANIAPYYDEDNNHIGYSAIRTDITDQKNVEQLHKKLEILLNNISMGVLLISRDLKVKGNYSKECSKIFNKNKIEGEKVSDLLFGNDMYKKELIESSFDEYFRTHDIKSKTLLLSLLPNKFESENNKILIEYKIIDENELMLLLTIIE